VDFYIIYQHSCSGRPQMMHGRLPLGRELSEHTMENLTMDYVGYLESFTPHHNKDDNFVPV